jgi:hypothetical protein
LSWILSRSLSRALSRADTDYFGAIPLLCCCICRFGAPLLLYWLGGFWNAVGLARGQGPDARIGVRIRHLTISRVQDSLIWELAAPLSPRPLSQRLLLHCLLSQLPLTEPHWDSTAALRNHTCQGSSRRKDKSQDLYYNWITELTHCGVRKGMIYGVHK